MDWVEVPDYVFIDDNFCLIYALFARFNLLIIFFLFSFFSSSLQGDFYYIFDHVFDDFILEMHLCAFQLKPLSCFFFHMLQFDFFDL